MGFHIFCCHFSFINLLCVFTFLIVPVYIYLIVLLILVSVFVLVHVIQLELNKNVPWATCLNNIFIFLYQWSYNWFQIFYLKHIFKHVFIYYDKNETPLNYANFCFICLFHYQNQNELYWPGMFTHMRNLF